MKTFSFTRQELYEQVWTKPMVTLAKEYFLSDNGLRKICKNFDIPLPYVGYWQKLQFGKKVVKTPLSKKDKEQEIKISVEEVKLKASSNNPIRNMVTERIRLNKSLVFKVSERLNKPDDIIVKAQANLEKKKISDFYGQVKGTVHTDKGFPSIMVTPENISRSLRILNNLIKNFRFLGYKINISDEGLSILAYDDSMTIYVREKSNAVDTTNERGWKSRDLVANGKLAVKVGRFRTFEFIDTNKALVEDQIEKILIKIETEFQEMVEKRRWWQAENQKQEKLRKIEEGKQKLKDDELNKFIEFYNNAHRWKKYMVLQEYFEYVKDQVDKLPDTQIWLEWAAKKLDWYNPAKNIDDSLLDEVNKDTLELKKRNRWDQ